MFGSDAPKATPLPHRASSQSPSAPTLAWLPLLRYRPTPESKVAEVIAEISAVGLWKLAREWDSRMRNRKRWIHDESLRRELADLGRQHLNSWHVDEPTIAAMARAQIVEVVYDPENEKKQIRKHAVEFGLRTAAQFSGAFLGPFSLAPAFSAILGAVGFGLEEMVKRELAKQSPEPQMRRMPWESLLTMAVHQYQNHERLLVYRRLAGLGDRKGTYATESTKPLKALFVETAPGALWDVYDFDLELKAVETYLRGLTVERQQSLSLPELRACIEHIQPTVIHLSGIDGIQGFSILHGTSEAPAAPARVPSPAPPASPEVSEGVYFRNDLGQPKVETPEAVAAALCSAEKKPLLVTFNLYNSSARLAAETVRSGAAAAIGIQDFIDDTVSDIFFANLFRAWSERDDVPLLQAFQTAVRELDPYLPRVRGSAMVLWTSEPLLESDNAICLPARKARSSRRTRPRVDLEFDIEPYPALNYSVLHNGKSKMFETFRIFKFSYEEQVDLRVEVNLNVGGRNFPFRQSFRMEDHILDLTEAIAVSLTSTLTRSLRESVRTTIFVRITLGPDDERFCKTFDVSILAVDEWIDDAPSGIFLPSFILPRDPMVSAIIRNAQRYLMALADDASQGFDGYQSCEDSNDDPAAALEPQIRAIWYALQHDFALKYINPPPTFTQFSQRLRTPSEILKGGRGTCIDLTLLLAACFEHIGLHPVIFLLSGHAFPGYWTDEERRKNFRTKKFDLLPSIIDPGPRALYPRLSTAQKSSFLSWLTRNQPTSPDFLDPENIITPVEWKYESRRRGEILLAIRKGELVAIEATYLTNGGSFVDACEVGESNLEANDDFESMLDISLARENNVTPLPLSQEEEPS